MAVPKRKTSPSKRNMRRAHDGLPTSKYHECANCGEMTRTHHICAYCGYYNGREVLIEKEDRVA